MNQEKGETREAGGGRAGRVFFFFCCVLATATAGGEGLWGRGGSRGGINDSGREAGDTREFVSSGQRAAGAGNRELRELRTEGGRSGRALIDRVYTLYIYTVDAGGKKARFEGKLSLNNA